MSDANQSSGAGPTATSGPTAMLKLGGEVIADLPALAAMLTDVRALLSLGWRFVVCHGGGPQASALQERLRVPTVKVGGRRVTDAATLQIMKQVLAGEVSVDLVAAAVAAGVPAVGVSGVSCGIVTAHRRPKVVVRQIRVTPSAFHARASARQSAALPLPADTQGSRPIEPGSRPSSSM